MLRVAAAGGVGRRSGEAETRPAPDGNADRAALAVDTPAAEVPLAFQSAMAGIMLAAEVVAECGGQRGHAWPTKSVVDLTRPLPPRWSVPVLKRPAASGPQCICQDADYVRAYRRKYYEAHG